MEGVEILSVVPYQINNVAGLQFFSMMLFAAAVGCVIYGIGEFFDQSVKGIAVSVFFATFFVFLSAYIWIIEAVPIYKDSYKVTITDEVSLNDFNEKYEILGQDGRIYHIIEREED